jgi:molecular chaperone Hsp33
MPEGEEGRERLHVRMDHPEWEHVATLAGSTRQDELLDPDLSLEALIWRLFHEEDEIRVEQLASLSRGCRCTVEHYRSVLSRFPADELDAMRGDDGTIGVDCAFCSKVLQIDL